MKFIKSILLITLIVLLASCEKKTENTMTVTGSIDGLKKGTLYFQKTEDSLLVNLDSLKITGDGSFSFSYEIESPEIFYLYLDKLDNNEINDRIKFFGEVGDITINTSWNTFDIKPEIFGSKTHEKYIEFQDMLSKFNTKDFELAQYILKQSGGINEKLLDSIDQLSKNNLLRKYRYIINFGLTNPDSYVTPYVILNEAEGANTKYIDSVSNTLSKEVSNSKYGKALKEYLKTIQ